MAASDEKAKALELACYGFGQTQHASEVPIRVAVVEQWIDELPWYDSEHGPYLGTPTRGDVEELLRRLDVAREGEAA